MDEATAFPFPSTSTIVTRLSFIASLLLVSMYANYESSKHFDITVSADADSYQHRRFNLLFISNGRASRILLESNIQMKKIIHANALSLYPKSIKIVQHVHVQLANEDMHEAVVVDNGFIPGRFVITLNQNLMMERDVVKAVETELKKAMMEMTLRSLAGRGAKEDNMIRLLLEKKLTLVEDFIAASAMGTRQVI